MHLLMKLGWFEIRVLITTQPAKILDERGERFYKKNRSDKTLLEVAKRFLYPEKMHLFYFRKSAYKTFISFIATEDDEI